MKSTSRNVGSVNMRGKKVKVLSCKCCTAYDFREDELEKLHINEMRNVGREAEGGGLLNR